MDREGFRDRMKQYKKARGENPGLKYWEWKDIPKYDEGTGAVMGPPTEEQWQQEQRRYNPKIIDDYSFDRSIELLKEELHNKAMQLPGYATMWNEYVRTLPKAEPDINEFIDDLWENENPNNAGYNRTKNKYFPHKSPEGGKKTIGPGFKLGSGLHRISEREANRGVTKYRLNQEARRLGNQHLDAVNTFLNQGQTTNPADTVSPQIKMGLMDLRHQVGPLGEWGKLRDAVLEGDLDKIRKESTVTWNDNGEVKVDKRRKNIRDNKYFHYAEGGQVEPDPLEVLERSRSKVAGIPINDKPLSGTDPIGEAMMWGLGGGAASVALRSLFPTYGATAGWLAFGDNNKENVLIVPNNVNKSKLPVAKDLVNYDVKEFFENDVVPRDVIYPIESKQSFLNDANFMYDIYPESHFEQNVAGYYDNINKKVIVNNLYAGDQKSINRIGTHEFGHKYNDQFELDDPHKRILNNAYTVEENKIGRTARGARRTNEKRETNKNIRYDMYVELQEKLGRSPSPSEVDDFIDSLSDREILRRVRNSNMYGSAYFESINERAQRIKQPIGTYTRTRASKIRKALKQVAMNERSKDNQNYA